VGLYSSFVGDASTRKGDKMTLMWVFVVSLSLGMGIFIGMMIERMRR